MNSSQGGQGSSWDVRNTKPRASLAEDSITGQGQEEIIYLEPLTARRSIDVTAPFRLEFWWNVVAADSKTNPGKV